MEYILLKMVFFTCTHCGEALKKPRVEKHFQFQCRNPISVSCMDCFKDFRGQEYVAHTKCITEAQRYGGKDFVAKPSKNKGERKQQDWILVVQSVIETSKNLSSGERNILNILSSHENVPRKKAKFFNFIKSVLAGRVNISIVESVWGKMEEALKKASENKITDGNSQTGVESAKNRAESLSQEDDVENENNENLSKEYERAEPGAKQNGKSGDLEIGSELSNDRTERKSRKSKKRKTTESLETQEEQSSIGKSKTGKKSDIDLSCSLGEQNGIESKKSKKRKTDETVENFGTTAADESQNNRENIVQNGEASITKFDWSDAILKVVRSKGEISLKKLRKKVLADYRNSSNKTITEEKAAAKFDKKINKISQIVVTNGKVKLVT